MIAVLWYRGAVKGDWHKTNEYTGQEAMIYYLMHLFTVFYICIRNAFETLPKIRPKSGLLGYVSDNRVFP